MMFKKLNLSDPDLFRIRCWLQIAIGSVLVITSVVILKRALLCLCPQQFLLLSGSFLSGAGLVIFSIHLLREEHRMRKLVDEIN